MTDRQLGFWDKEFEADMQCKRLARSSDPQTSHAAAEHIVRSGRVRSLQTIAFNAIVCNPGKTASELAQITGEANLHKRMAELERQDLIYRGRPKTCSVTGRQAITYWPNFGEGN